MYADAIFTAMPPVRRTWQLFCVSQGPCFLSRTLKLTDGLQSFGALCIFECYRFALVFSLRVSTKNTRIQRSNRSTRSAKHTYLPRVRSKTFNTHRDDFLFLSFTLCGRTACFVIRFFSETIFVWAGRVIQPTPNKVMSNTFHEPFATGLPGTKALPSACQVK